jgi:SanA protein
LVQNILQVLRMRLIKGLKYFFVFLVLLCFWANYSVYSESKNYLYQDLKETDTFKVGLVLGTGKFLKNDLLNPYFIFRIEAAVELFKAGKIKYILVSGDNGHSNYNEPEDMRDELIARGVPADRITLDYAGFDTYDSVIRASEVFQENKFIVISQHFHNQRAVYIARRFGIAAFGYDATDIIGKRSIRIKIREWFACVKAYIEVKLGVDPHFLGEKIKIG